MAGLRGLARTPTASTRSRRNADNFASVLEFIGPDELIQISEGGVFFVVLNDNGGLVSTGGALAINPGDGLALLANELLVSLGATPGLKFTAGGLVAKVRDNTLTLDAGGLGVALAPGGGIGESEDGLLIVGGIPITTETPAGTIDGVNDEFTLAGIPQEGEVLLFANGLLMFDDAAGDYERDGSDVTFNAGAVPEVGDRLLAVYLEGIGAAGEVPSGLVDGANDTFTLSAEPQAASTMLFHNGVMLAQGATADYTIDGTTITFDAAGIPVAGDRLYAAYEREEV